MERFQESQLEPFRTNLITPGTSLVRRRKMKHLLISIGCILLALAPCRAATRPQQESDQTVHVLRARGFVTDTYGKPVAQAQVTLSRNDKIISETTTGAAGEFRFDHVDGQYTVRIKDAGNSPATRQIVVGEAAMLLLHQNTLYVILGPGACAEECSSVFTSKREFDRAISKKNSHNH
jgi:hypothetical protein